MQQDVRDACRLIWRAKAFTAAAVSTLALGIAGTTVMFAMIQGVLLRPLPVENQDRVILSWKEARTSGSAQYPFGNTEIQAVADASRLFENVAGVTRNGVARTVVSLNGGSSYANVGLVTGGFFDVLGVRAQLGRTFTLADDNDGAEPVLVISSGFWTRYFGRSREVIGQRLTLGERPFTIVGVMPADLDYPSGVEIWRLTTTVPTNGPFGDAARREVNLVGRLGPGVTLEQANSEISLLSQRIDAGTAPMRDLVPVVRPFAEIVVGDVGRTMIALFAAVALVLLIASANVANLLLMRGEARRGELALRSALGAGRGRIIRHMLGESLVLSTLAGVVGIAIGWLSLQAVVAIVPDGLPRVESIRVDRTVVLFSVGVTFVTALLAGLTPALLALRLDLVSSLRGSGRELAGGSSNRGRRVLVVAQVALAVTVLAGAGVLIRSVLRLHAIDLGFAAERLVLLELHLPPAKYAERHARAQFLDGVVEQLGGVPGILSTTPVNVSPFSNRGWDVPQITAEGQSADDARLNPSLNLESIHPNYFATFEVPIVHGRAFTALDRQGTVPVAIVSEDLAGRLWPDGIAIGKRLKMGPVESRAPWCEIVGVAAETRYRTVTASRPTLYLPAAQFQMTATMLVARTSASLEAITSIARERIGAVDGDVQLMRVAPFAELLDRPLARPRFNAFVLTVFAAAALLLTAIGLYALMAVHVRQRHREIALRLALGATGADVRRLMLTEAAKLAGAGIVIGLIGAVAASQLLGAMLFEVSPLDPVSLIGAASLILAAAALASYPPVHRAERADAIAILRGQ